MKTFIWENSHHSPEKNQFLKENFNKPLSEKEYVDVMKKDYKKFSNGNGKNKNYKPHNLKKEYRRLRKSFGFFPIPE